MTRIAIIGGGISGLCAAYELEKARQGGAPLDWHLYEASDRLGGIVDTTRLSTAEGEYILEGGPDGWVSEKPWARELAIELGLGDELIYSNDSTRRTYIYLDGRLQAISDRMRLMVPESLEALENSLLFSATAKRSYADELARAEELKAHSPLLDPAKDESVASFVLRHFGDEVLTKLAAPLLSGVFGGDVHKLSVRAVMPQFVRMEREYGSLIGALQQAKRERGDKPPQPIFTSLRRGVASLVEALLARLPRGKVQTNAAVRGIGEEHRWLIAVDELNCSGHLRPQPSVAELYDHLVLATSLDASRTLLNLDGFQRRLESLLPSEASSAFLVSFTWPADLASTFSVPTGFGFLVPQQQANPGAPPSPTASSSAQGGMPQLLACTFVDQKFPYRAPAGTRILRAFFGTEAAEHLASASDAEVTEAALAQLTTILGFLPQPAYTSVRRWPRSLPQYEIGHLQRMTQLDQLVATVPGLTLLGSSYRGVGLPDLVRDARTAAQRIIARVSKPSP